MEIKGSEAVVTGAAGGLGAAIARALHARGARLFLTDRRKEDLESLASQLNGAEAFVCDLADSGQVADLAARLTSTDIVVANAALPATGKLEDFTPEQLNRAVDVNLRVPMLMTKQLLPGMLQHGRGHFVYISSIAGKLPSARVPIYSATKAGLRGFCGSLRQDLHGSGVGASVVFPGTMTDAGLLADAGLPSTPGTKGTSCDFVARRVIAAIEKNLGEVNAAELPIRIMARFGGVAPELAARLARRKDSIAWGDQVTEGLRHLR
ncbi:SDR family NAD(P)-dependent oxidoreductase [Mycobacterium sp. GA-1199]|uniref:SDR family NAD(P)-dependent oxidoreductase n=1 Tax=Mycobacterium sp. GA-1199 TaxID=1772287 RepID=UPI0009E67962|nr:SDR family NAD(P)-dependent oxidoreductase [Mycobacterium sp. GA-1199]